jgi:glycine/D-amino acid oxidase-like deaminating enzyme
MLVALGGAVIAYAACGGSSFKFAPLIARSLAQRVAGLTPEPTGLPALDQRPAHVLT